VRFRQHPDGIRLSAASGRHQAFGSIRTASAGHSWPLVNMHKGAVPVTMEDGDAGRAAGAHCALRARSMDVAGKDAAEEVVMADHIRVMIEQGKRKAVAAAFDWPGWVRPGPTEADAIRVLASYRERYAPVAGLAGLAGEFAAAGDLEIVERIPGNGTTDFWGLSARPASVEIGATDEAVLERKITLLRACWARFDEVAARVSAELRKGVRGGGRDRDQIWRHVVVNEADAFSTKIGVRFTRDEVLAPGGLQAQREAFCAAFRDYNARGLPARSWELQYLLRHAAYHVMDHAWEMEDKDLSATPQA
jgi:hypothetical protein